MSGETSPTAPLLAACEIENQALAPASKFYAPHAYNPYYRPGPQGPAMPPAMGYPAGLPAVYFNAPQPTNYPLHQVVSSAPIQYQPGKYPMPVNAFPVPWMPGAAPMPNCPPGLELLAQLDSIHVLQHFQIMKRLVNFEVNNKYDVRNDRNQMVYVVTEDTDDYSRNKYRTLRPFVLRVTDALGREVMTMQRPFTCTYCCYCFFSSIRQEMEVQCPPGVTLGFVRECWQPFYALYSVQNEKREDVMRIRGPCGTYSCCSDSDFEVLTLDGTSIGSITRKWTGVESDSREADHFEIHFPLNMDVKKKALVFGACFLIDFMYFEISAQSYHRRQTEENDGSSQETNHQ